MRTGAPGWIVRRSRSTHQDRARYSTGFASFALEATDPNIGGFLPDEVCAGIAKALGCEVRQVMAHY